jgi:hypothetical protein
MAKSPNVHQLYQSLPLNSDRREIRLLSLEDGKADDPLICSLWTVSVDNEPQFNALSYAWGNEEKNASIAINGIEVLVTTSVESALRSIRAHDTVASPIRFSDSHILPIWIDAICINQNDNDEKADQVLMMLTIYSKASNVLVWLGDGNAQTNAAFDLMCNRAFELGLKASPEELESPFQPSNSFFSSSQKSRSLLQGQDTFPPTPEWMMLETVMKDDVCRRSWWSRLWVRQEFVLARKPPLMMCGAKGISWDWFIFYFVHLARLWSHPDNASATETQRHGITGDVTAWHGIHPISLHYLREDFKQGGSLSLEKVFRYLVRNALASDPHDYIYGLLGLVSNKLQSRIMPDYSRHCMELYKEVGALLWREEPQAMIAELIHLYRFHGEDNGYPSWVPDFRQTKLRAWQDRKALQATGVWKQLRLPCFDEANECLILDGVVVDRVDAVYSTPDSLPDDKGLGELVRQYERIIREAQHRAVPIDNPIASLATMKRAESSMRLLTRSSVAQMDGDERFHPQYSDKDIWKAFLGRDALENSRQGDQVYVEGLFLRLRRMLTAKLENRCIFTTESGFAGIGVMGIEVGDVVTLLFGASGPVVLRPYYGFYRLVGCSYVSGLMENKTLDDGLNQGVTAEQTFIIR